MSRVHFSSAVQTWETPDAVFRALDDEFHFTVDVCATSATAKCLRFWTPRDNAMWQSWKDERCWMNPPYSEIAVWMKRAYEAWQANGMVVALIPSRTDTRWWHEYVMKATEIRFLRGRLKFGGAVDNAPFPSVVVIFRPEQEME